MSKHIGRDREVGLAKETTRGTVATPSFWLPFINFDFDDKFETITDEQAMGIIEDSNDLKIIKEWAEGTLEGHIRDKSFGLILLATLGAVSSAQKETTAYEHTYSVAQSIIHQSLTLEAKSPVEQLAFVNAMVNSLEIKAEVGKFVDFTLNVLAKKGTTATTTPAITAENKFIAKDVSVKFADDIAGLSSASVIKAKNVNITIDKNIESDDVLSDNEPDDFNNKQFGVSGSLELNYDATTYKELALAGTQKAMRIEIKDTSVTIGATSNPGLKIDLAKTKLTEWNKSDGLNDIIKQTIGFKAFYSRDDSQMIDIVLTNEITSY